MRRVRVFPHMVILAFLAVVMAFVLSGTLRSRPVQADNTNATLIDDHLLLCEAVLTPTSEEFIEIGNPSGFSVDLTDHYLSDDEEYALLPGAFGAGPSPTIDDFDFIAQFPDGASIPAGGNIIVAFDGAGFFASFGFRADYEIHGTDVATPNMVDLGFIGATAGLTNSGENATLFYWDGASDLVSDVDTTNLGTPSTSNDVGDKTGVTVDGPDGNTTASAYAADAVTMPQQSSDPGFGFSTKRIALEGANESTGGGNGITGDDETTENIAVTWDSAFSAPNPGTCAVVANIPIVQINEFAPKDGPEWIELYNAGTSPQDLTGWTITDEDGTVDNLSGTLAAGDYLVINNTFGLDNGGDEIFLYNDSAALMDYVAYGNVGGAPLPETGHSSARVGGDTDDNARDWNLDPTPTQGTANDVPANDLGSSLLINEIDVFPAVGDDVVEIYNPTGAPIDLTGWALSDGDSLEVLAGGVVPAGGWLALTENTDFFTDFSSTDVAYLYYASGVRADQIGWTGEFEDDCFARTPDGDGVNDGYDWASSDGGNTWVDQPCTLGSANGGELSLNKTAPEFDIIGSLTTYTITINNAAIVTATNLVLTDTLPAGVTYVSDTSGIVPTNPSPGVYVWDFGDVPPLTLIEFNINAFVGGGIASGTMLTNTAELATDSVTDTAQAVTTVYPLVSIYDVQTVLDPVADDASTYEGQIVWVQGVVTAEPGDIDDPNEIFVLQDASGGAWSGLSVFKGSAFPSLNAPVGSSWQALGTVDEFFGLTQLDIAGATAAIRPAPPPLVDSGGPAPEILNTSDYDDTDPATSEQWESVFIEFQDATVTDDDLGFGEWEFDDGSGPARADDLGEIDGDLSYLPSNGDLYVYIRGIAWYSFSNYKLVPRSDADIRVFTDVPFIDKTVAPNVDPGGLVTYTLTVENNLGYSLNGVVVTDAVPVANATFSAALDGGVFDGTDVTWNLGTLADGASADVRFVMTASGPLGSVITNDQYAIVASNFVTPTFGAPRVTVIGNIAPIGLIQGAGDESPFRGNEVTTQGVVVGFFEGNFPGFTFFDGVFIQDPIGDGNPNSSDGIFVNYGTLPVVVSMGDVISVTGVVQEFSEFDEDDCNPDEGCLTQIAIASTGDVQVIGTDTIAPTIIDPPGDPVASRAYMESLESMLVTLPMTGVVSGPTSFGTIQVIPGDEGVERALRTSPQEGMPFGVRHYEVFGDIGGSDPPGLIVGSVVDNVAGPLGFSYGSELVVTQAGTPWTVVFSEPAPTDPDGWPAPTLDEFSVATFNTLNYDAGDDATKLTKIVNTIDEMNGPTFLSLEEIAVEEVITDVLTSLAGLGYPYDYGYSHADVGNHGVAILWRTDRVTSAVWSDQYQGCSPFGSSSSVAYDDFCDGVPGEFPLFSRRPVVLTATVDFNGGTEDIIVIANHFKSKLGGAPSDQRRLEQGTFVAALVDQLVVNTPHVIVMGDLNDFEDSPTLNAMYASGNLLPTWDFVPFESRYTFIFQGVSQILDHVLVSPAMMTWLQDMAVLHNNADYPFLPYSDDPATIFRTTDHDEVVATFGVQPALSISKVVDVGVGLPEPGDTVTYTITIDNTGIADAMNVTVTDTLPAELIGSDLNTTVSVPAGGSVELTIVATIDPSTPLGTTIDNTAYYAHSSGSGSAMVSFTLDAGEAILSIGKTVDVGVGLPQPGDTVTYTITIDNTGIADAMNVTVTDTLPAELIGSDLNTTVSVPAGGSVELTIVATIDPSTPLGTTIDNTAYYAHSSGSGSASVSFTLDSEPEMFYLYMPIIPHEAAAGSSVAVRPGDGAVM